MPVTITNQDQSELSFSAPIMLMDGRVGGAMLWIPVLTVVTMSVVSGYLDSEDVNTLLSQPERKQLDYCSTFDGEVKLDLRSTTHLTFS